jgi:outer membrane protein TolC
MKVPFRFSLVLATLLSPVRSEPWTLDRALAVAATQNSDAKLARYRIEGAESLVEQARSAWMPQVFLKGGYTLTNNSMMAFGSILNQRAFSFALDFNHPGAVDNLNATGLVAYNVYSGGRAGAGREAAEAGVRAASQDAAAVRNQLATEVVKAYLGIRKAREAVAAVESGAKAYEAAVAMARARWEAGQMLKADLLSLEVQLAQTRETLSGVRHGAALAEQAFLFVLGSEVSSAPVELATEDPALVRIAAPATQDFSARPELQGLQERVRAADSMLRAARGGRKPTVNAFASYQVDQGWKTARHADSWMAGLSLDLSVFDGGQTSGKIRQSAAELAQVKEMLRKASLGIALEVRQASLAHDDAKERLSVSSRAVEQAEESASLTRARFEKGAVLVADLIGVESRLVETRMRRTLAEADERIALTELRRALGLLPVPQS